MLLTALLRSGASLLAAEEDDIAAVDKATADEANFPPRPY